MIKNHLKIGWRTMVKDQTYTVINILGLAIGLGACMLVFNVVIDELSYDTFWSRADDLYTAYSELEIGDGVYQKEPKTAAILGKSLKDNFPEVEQFSDISTREEYFQIGPENTDPVAMRILAADTNALSMFDFEPANGSRLPHFVAGQQNVLITESFRDRHFKGLDPTGHIIKNTPSWSTEEESYLITGIIKDIPQNTHLRAEAIVLTEPVETGLEKNQQSWGVSKIYYLLKSGVDAQAFTKKATNWLRQQIDSQQNVTIGLQPLSEIYLDSTNDGIVTVKGSRNTIRVLTGVGILLLLIACINFVNLSTARAIKRIKEMGLRKTLGAQRRQLVWQFLTESLLFFFIATLFATFLYALGLPVVESFMGHKLAHSLLSNLGTFGAMLLLVIILSILTGAYPAWLVSGFKPASTLRGNLFRHTIIGAGSLRKALVVVQFAVAVVVLVALLVVRQQLNYIASKPIGYNKENLLNIGSQNWEGKGDAFKNELKKLPGIETVSIANWTPTNGGGSTMSIRAFDVPAKEDEKVNVHFIVVDFDFVQTMGLKLQQGRFPDASYGNDVYDFDVVFESDSAEKSQYIRTRSTLITASTAETLDIHELGVPIPKLGYPPVGIIDNFHRESLHYALAPMFILFERSPYRAPMFIRTVPGMEQQAQQSLATLWKEFYPGRVLDAQWVTDILDRQYEAEMKQQALFSFFSGLMLFLSAMGVFGLIVHAAQQRIKEIGIRKVLGASVSGIVQLLSTDFIKLVLVAVIVASPIAWWLMSRWLEDFAYRIDIQWWMFAVAGSVAVAIALLTVSWQAIRAAVANPVDSLRDE